MLRALLVAFGLASLLLLNACGSRSDDTAIFIQSDPANDFLLFPNSHASLGVGDYKVVFTNTNFPADPTPYTLMVIFSDGTSAVFSGTWTMVNDSIVRVIEVNRPGGIIILLNSGGATATLSLCSAGVPSLLCSAGAATGVIASTSAAVNPSISLARHQIDQATYAQAYYATIDPLNVRDTLAKWQATNGFGPCDYEVRFRDVRDLGYGRHICARRDSITGDIAVFVENFQVTAVPGQDYGPLNLDAVVNNDRRWHIGTNAIEYSPTPSSGVVKIVKFYTFDPDGSRRSFVDLDGKGGKAMPVPCISCHGGTALPLTATGLFPTIGAFPRAGTRAQMQPINLDTLDFSVDFPYRRVDQEAAIKGINQYVLCSYPLPLATAKPTGNAEDVCRSVSTLSSEWQGTAAEMVKSWYGGPGMPSTAASDTYVPTDWTDAASVAGAQDLYQTVVAPYCRVCHLLRGNANTPGANDIDFTSYDKFAGTSGFSDRIKYHVFDRGNMPLALLKYNQFWGSTAPATLAPFIPGATDGSGNVIPPTRPVAIPGPDRTVRPGTTKLSAAESVIRRPATQSDTLKPAVESVNASYRWRVVTGPCTLAPGQENLVRPILTTAIGICTIELIVSDGNTNSDPAILTVVVSGMAPSGTNFSDIKTILQNDPPVNPPTACTTSGCHTSPTDDPGGPPVYYTDYDRLGTGDPADAANLHQFYLDVRARISFVNVESSPLLQRPSGNHHPAGLIAGFDTSLPVADAGRVHYDTFLNWILAGAPE